MPEKQEQIMLNFFNRFVSSAVKPSELITSIKVLTKLFDKKVAYLLDLINKNKTQTDNNISSLSQNLNLVKKQLTELVNSKDERIRATLERELKYVWDQIKTITETMPKEYDDTLMHEMLEEVKKSIPKIDNTELNKLEQKLSDLKIKDIDGLEEALKKLIKQQSKGATYTTPPTALYRPLHEVHTVTSATTTLSLAQAVSAEGTAIFVRYQGQMLDLDEHYTVNGNRVTFSNDITFIDNTLISITYWG